MSDIIVAVYNRFDKLAKAPRMWAATKEGFLAQVALLLDLVGKTKEASELYIKEFAVPGTNLMKGMADTFDDAWAQDIITKSRRHLPRYPDRW